MALERAPEPTVPSAKKRFQVTLADMMIAVAIAAVFLVALDPFRREFTVYLSVFLFQFFFFPAFCVRTVFQAVRRRPLSASAAILAALVSIHNSLVLTFIFGNKSLDARFATEANRYPFHWLTAVLAYTSACLMVVLAVLQAVLLTRRNRHLCSPGRAIIHDRIALAAVFVAIAVYAGAIYLWLRF